MTDLRRTGSGRPILMIHGLGGSRRSWDTIAAPLAEQRELILFDLPGHGGCPAEPDSGTFAGLMRSVTDLIAANGLRGVDMVGSSMGARIVLDLARQGLSGKVVALDPGGFWQGWERPYFKRTLLASAGLLRAVRPALPSLTRNRVSRTALLAQLSARPWRLDGAVVATELDGLAATPTFDALVRDLADGPGQRGPAAPESGEIVIGWGRSDRLCLPRQARRAQAQFPDAKLVWFDRCGHFPHWDRPRETVELILRSTG